MDAAIQVLDDSGGAKVSPQPASNKPILAVDVTPAWRTGAFVGEFTDAYIKDSELEGGLIALSLVTVADTLSLISQTSRLLASSLSATECRALSSLAAHLRAAGGRSVDRKYADNLDVAYDYLLKTRQVIDGIEDGDYAIIPGGWRRPGGGHVLLFVIESPAAKQRAGSAASSAASASAAPAGGAGAGAGSGRAASADMPARTAAAAAAGTTSPMSRSSTLSLTICNTGGGIQYHASTAEDYPKNKVRATKLPRQPSNSLPTTWQLTSVCLPCFLFLQ